MSSHGSGDTRFWVTMTLRDDVESLAGPDSLGPGRRGRSECWRWSPGAAWRVIGELVRTASAAERLRWGPREAQGARPQTLDADLCWICCISPHRDSYERRTAIGPVGSDLTARSKTCKGAERSLRILAWSSLIVSQMNHRSFLRATAMPSRRLKAHGLLRATRRRIGEARSFTGDHACLKCVRL